MVDYYNQGLTVHGSWDDMRRYYKLNDVSVYLVKVEPGYSLDSVSQNIERVHGQRRRLTLESNEALRSQALRLMAQVFGMFDVVVIIAMLVAAMGVVNTLTMNVMERTREIGMLRGLGMTRGQVAKIVLAEAGLMGLIGGTFGTVFGIFVSRAALTAMTARQGYELTYVLPTAGIVASTVVAVVVSQLAALWPARRAAGLVVIEALSYE
jgi:putative ABC transport system permease protein